jgi:hypothetical protein
MGEVNSFYMRLCHVMMTKGCSKHHGELARWRTLAARGMLAAPVMQACNLTILRPTALINHSPIGDGSGVRQHLSGHPDPQLVLPSMAPAVWR